MSEMKKFDSVHQLKCSNCDCSNVEAVYLVGTHNNIVCVICSACGATTEIFRIDTTTHEFSVANLIE